MSEAPRLDRETIGMDAHFDDEPVSGPRPCLTPADAAHPWPAGFTLERDYRIERVLGQGGFAVVYEASHPTLGVVAVKALDPVRATSPSASERFVREAEIAAAIEHPNVTQVYDLGYTEDGTPFLVMELLFGEDLSDLIERQRLDIAATVELGVQLSRAIEALDDAGVLHRDLKPHNVLMHGNDGVIQPKLIDFGIATSTADSGLFDVQKLTRTGVILGTPHYLSPEQARGAELDVRADLYALGVVLFESVCGRAPFEEGSLSDLMASVLRDERPPVSTFLPDCPPELDAILGKAIRRDRDERYQTPAELRAALTGFAESEGLPVGDAAFASIRLTSKVTLPWELRSLAPVEPPGSDELPTPPSLDATAPRELSSGRADGATEAWVPDRQASGRPDRDGVSWRRHIAPLAAAAGLVAGLGLAGFMGEGETVQSAKADAGPPVAVGHAPAPTPMAPGEAAETPEQDTLSPSTESGPSAESEPVAASAPSTSDDEPGDRDRRSGSNERDPRAAPNGSSAEPETPSADLLERRAHRAYVRGRLAQARRLYIRATRADSRSKDAWRGYGLVAERMGRGAEARRALRRYLRLAPNASDSAEVRRTLASL